ncbi:ATP-binding protein [Hanamia caeni]|jgi:hypothetical protein|uniref:ATP-binding protein n=1 Tax=Hanamia caeni TaxID=2294116 RepID=A0A3M9NRU0_9BACT|nr:ATP-binding protein [Hanamia caeni]RNI39758.1 ATP-binding protein [Hanamia caeni]
MPSNDSGTASDSGLFIGLESYSEAQSNIFYGRDDETDQLTGLVKTNTLTIVFGKSGTGKTSLLNAGIFPILRKEFFLPFRIRLEFKEDSPELVDQIKNVLKTQIDKYGFNASSYPDSKTTLWEYFHSEPLWKTITPILVFDQFEEIFTLAKKANHFGANELATFWDELADVIENSIPRKLKDEFLNEKQQVKYGYKDPKAKIIFAFREEYLPEFESVSTKIPAIKYSRFRLLPMNGNQAYTVITKTWQSKIDESEAHKIVSFLVNEEDVDKNYDMLAIEPSLLSQVCTYIDKERVSQNQNKISSGFLAQYPKEKILHSIYNQVLNESNQAVLGPNPGPSKSLRPVNDFLEDKLITDEGYRTKYSINEIDRTLLPGIEVLKRKYFVREDGKSIELTHDVLAPIIKDDREERRKLFAEKEAKKRANKRFLVIAIIAVLAAIAIWFAIAGKAVHDKDEAVKQKAQIDEQIKASTDSLNSLQDSIGSLRKTLNNGRYVSNNRNQNSSVDNPEAAGADSLKTDSLQNRFAEINNQRSQLKNEIALQDAQIAELLDNKKASALLNDQAKSSIEFLQRRVTFDSIKLLDLQQAYTKLSLEFQDYRRKHPELIRPKQPVIAHPEDTNSLKLKVSFEAGKPVPKNLLIYLLPEVKANEKLIKRSKVYEIGCDPKIETAKGKKTAQFVNGLYVFYDVPPGKYFLKVCAYYGGYQEYRKTNNGNVTINFDASPPIR